MAGILFSGVVGPSAVQTESITLPQVYHGVGLAVLSSFSATSATTGVQVEAAFSLDGGATFGDFEAVTTTDPQASSASPVKSQKNVTVEVPFGTTDVQFRLTNLDDTNAANVTASYVVA